MSTKKGGFASGFGFLVQRGQCRHFPPVFRRFRMVADTDDPVVDGEGDLLTPEVVHYGLAKTVINRRNQVLVRAYQAHPERFVRKIPTAPELPESVWINPPEKIK